MKGHIVNIVSGATLLLLCVLLSGCGVATQEADPERDLLCAYADGSVELTISELFTRDYYSEEEMVGSIEADLADYNSRRGEVVVELTGHSLTQTEEGPRAAVTLRFASCEDCEAYAGVEVYIGDVQGAYDAGYDFNQALQSRRDEGRVIGKNDLMQMANRKIVVYKGDARLVCPGGVDYYSFGMKLIDGKTVEPDTGEGAEPVAGIYMVMY